MEVGARIVELLLPVERTLPTPAPGNHESHAKVTAEARERLGMPRRDLIEYQLANSSDPRTGWLLPANTTKGIFRSNSHGLRGPDLADAEPGEVRILVLGDSSAFGSNVEEDEALGAIAAAQLSASWKRKVVHVNGAIPGHDSNQSVRVLTKFGGWARPSWVVVTSLWSDIYRGDHFRNPSNDGYYGPPALRVLRASAVYRVLRRALDPWLSSRKVGWLTSEEDIGSTQGGPDTRVLLPRYVSNLETMASRARALGARPVFIMLPAPMDFDVVPPPTTVQEFRLAMRSAAERVGAPLIDGPAEFRRRGAGPAYFFDQVHPTQEGHAILGEALAEVIETVGPPPGAGWRY